MTQHLRHLFDIISKLSNSLQCGGSEIRTHDARRHGAFQERWNKPLSDSSI